MPDRQQDPESVLQASESSSSRPAEKGVPFRLIADFLGDHPKPAIDDRVKTGHREMA